MQGPPANSHTRAGIGIKPVDSALRCGGLSLRPQGHRPFPGPNAQPGFVCVSPFRPLSICLLVRSKPEVVLYLRVRQLSEAERIGLLLVVELGPARQRDRGRPNQWGHTMRSAAVRAGLDPAGEQTAEHTTIGDEAGGRTRNGWLANDFTVRWQTERQSWCGVLSLRCGAAQGCTSSRRATGQSSTRLSSTANTASSYRYGSSRQKR